MIKNEFCDNSQDLWINPAAATIVVWIFPGDLLIYYRLIVGLVLWCYLISRDFVFWLMFFSIMKVSRKFEDRNVVLANFPFVSGRTGDK